MPSPTETKHPPVGVERGLVLQSISTANNVVHCPIFVWASLYIYISTTAQECPRDRYQPLGSRLLHQKWKGQGRKLTVRSYVFHRAREKICCCDSLKDFLWISELPNSFVTPTITVSVAHRYLGNDVQGLFHRLKQTSILVRRDSIILIF